MFSENKIGIFDHGGELRYASVQSGLHISAGCVAAVRVRRNAQHTLALVTATN